MRAKLTKTQYKQHLSKVIKSTSPITDTKIKLGIVWAWPFSPILTVIKIYRGLSKNRIEKNQRNL